MTNKEALQRIKRAAEGWLQASKCNRKDGRLYAAIAQEFCANEVRSILNELES